MSINKLPAIQHKRKLILLCAVAFTVGLLGIHLISKVRYTSPQKPKIGFDFSSHMNLDWSGPKVGERLDLQWFIGRTGEKLTDAVDSDMFMLATIDPDCAAGSVARDELQDVQTHIAGANVPYILVSATNDRTVDDFFRYAESLGIDAPIFLWSSKEKSPPESLVTMVIPSHILVRRDGTILHTWPGTSKSKRIRFQMVNQIVNDTVEIAATQH